MLYRAVMCCAGVLKLCRVMPEHPTSYDGMVRAHVENVEIISSPPRARCGVMFDRLVLRDLRPENVL